jgi:hypothetical protein
MRGGARDCAAHLSTHAHTHAPQAEAELATLSEACASVVDEVAEARSVGAGRELPGGQERLLAGIAERLGSAAKGAVSSVCGVGVWAAP